MSDDATTARRKAMAEALKAKFTELLNGQKWDSATVWDEMAEAADNAAGEQRKDVP